MTSEWLLGDAVKCPIRVVCLIFVLSEVGLNHNNPQQPDFSFAEFVPQPSHFYVYECVFFKGASACFLCTVSVNLGVSPVGEYGEGKLAQECV